jgi:hypothetical protein
VKLKGKGEVSFQLAGHHIEVTEKQEQEGRALKYNYVKVRPKDGA